MSQDTSTQNEQWRPVYEFEEYYEVSNFGRVRALPRQVRRGSAMVWTKPAIRKATPDKGGYLVLALYGENGRKSRRVHRIVLEAFVGTRPSGKEARHKDGDPTNNHLANLEWCTRSTNTLDQVSHRTHNNTSKRECPQGHMYVGWNKLDRPNAGRGCRACTNASRVLKTDGITIELAPSTFQALADAYYYQYSFITEREVIND